MNNKPKKKSNMHHTKLSKYKKYNILTHLRTNVKTSKE